MNSDDSACVRDAAISHMNSVGHELYEAAEKFNSFAVAYKLAPFRDGNQWCVLLGSDIQTGVAGFGDTPAKAIADFERAMNAPISDLSAPAAVKESFTTEAPVAPAAQPDRLCGDYPEHQEWIDDGMPCPACTAEEEKAAQGVADDVVRDARLVEVWDWCRLTAQDFGNGNARQQAVAKAYLGIAHHIKSKYFRGCKDRDMFALLAAQQQKAGGE